MSCLVEIWKESGCFEIGLRNPQKIDSDELQMLKSLNLT